MNKILCRRLRGLREEKGWTQKEIGIKLNMSQTGYNQYEIGKNDVPTEILLKLSKIYDVNIDYILGKTNIKNYEKFINEIKIIEENNKCNYCNSKNLVHVNPLDYDFLCTKCGNINKIRTKNYN